MKGSLQDQLLQAGLTDEKKAKKAAKEKRKEVNLARHKGESIDDENKEAARQAMADKVQRDRELNQAKNSKALRKAINAQIKQLIAANKLQKGQGDVGFNFSDGKKVKSLYVTSLQHKQLSAGVLAIVKHGGGYEVIPRSIANKIAERDEDRVVSCEENADVVLTEEEKDWYKDHEIPDDLIW